MGQMGGGDGAGNTTGGPLLEKGGSPEGPTLGLGHPEGLGLWAAHMGAGTPRGTASQWGPVLEQKSSEKPGQRRRERKEEGRAAGNCCAGTAPSWAARCPSKGSRGAGMMCCESKGRQEERHWVETEREEGA